MTQDDFNELLRDVLVKLYEARKLVDNEEFDYEGMGKIYTYPGHLLSQSHILGRIISAISVAYDMTDDFITDF